MKIAAPAFCFVQSALCMVRGSFLVNYDRWGLWPLRFFAYYYAVLNRWSHYCFIVCHLGDRRDLTFADPATLSSFCCILSLTISAILNSCLSSSVLGLSFCISCFGALQPARARPRASRCVPEAASALLRLPWRAPQHAQGAQPEDWDQFDSQGLCSMYGLRRMGKVPLGSRRSRT